MVASFVCDVILLFLAPDDFFVFFDAIFRGCFVVVVLSCEGAGREGEGREGAGGEGAGCEGSVWEGAVLDWLLGEFRKPETRLRSRIRRNILTGMEESEIMKQTSTVSHLVASGIERVMHVHGPLK